MFEEQTLRFNRLFFRDKHKRSFYECISRFMIDEFSENQYLKTFNIQSYSPIIIGGEQGQYLVNQVLPIMTKVYLPVLFEI